MHGLQVVVDLVSKLLKARDFMPDLKVGRYVPVAMNNKTHMLDQWRLKLLVRIEANLSMYLSSLTISLKLPMLTLAYFYEIQMSFTKLASKTLSNIQSTAKYIY